MIGDQYVHVLTVMIIEFSLNVFIEFAEFSDKNICHYSKRAQTCHPVTSCVRDQDATTVPARHMWETVSLNWAQFMLQWFIRFPEFSEFLFHLGKTPISLLHLSQRRPIWVNVAVHQENVDFLKRSFSEKYSNCPGITVNWYFSKLTKIGYRILCPSGKESVLNSKWENPMRYGRR